MSRKRVKKVTLYEVKGYTTFDDTKPILYRVFTVKDVLHAVTLLLKTYKCLRVVIEKWRKVVLE